MTLFRVLQVCTVVLCASVNVPPSEDFMVFVRVPDPSRSMQAVDLPHAAKVRDVLVAIHDTDILGGVPCYHFNVYFGGEQLGLEDDLSAVGISAEGILDIRPSRAPGDLSQMSTFAEALRRQTRIDPQSGVSVAAVPKVEEKILVIMDEVMNGYGLQPFALSMRSADVLPRTIVKCVNLKPQQDPGLQARVDVLNNAMVFIIDPPFGIDGKVRVQSLRRPDVTAGVKVKYLRCNASILVRVQGVAYYISMIEQKYFWNAETDRQSSHSPIPVSEFEIDHRSHPHLQW